MEEKLLALQAQFDSQDIAEMLRHIGNREVAREGADFGEPRPPLGDPGGGRQPGMGLGGQRAAWGGVSGWSLETPRGGAPGTRGGALGTSGGAWREDQEVALGIRVHAENEGHSWARVKLSWSRQSTGSGYILGGVGRRGNRISRWPLPHSQSSLRSPPPQFYSNLEGKLPAHNTRITFPLTSPKDKFFGQCGRGEEGNGLWEVL